VSDLKSEFDAKGYVVIKQMFDAAELARMKAEIQRLLEQHSANGGVFVGLAANSDVFKEIAADSRIVNPLAAIIGPDIEFLSDKVVFKSKRVDYASPWHQDWPYWEGAHKLSVWVALDPATPENGCLKILPGSHKQSLTHDGAEPGTTLFGLRVDQSTVDESQADILPCEPGDAVIFHDLTLHASCPNVTGADRWALISTYRSASEPDLEYSWAVARAIVCGHGPKSESVPAREQSAGCA
jgi:ectoine hydroxylase-related dioxygenase (phytanoyl-CoA dioxygenase family)